MPTNVQVQDGLEGVVATTTRLSHVDGLAGELTIAGYSLEAIAPYATFEEMVYLLWHGELPTESEHVHFQAELAEYRAIPEITIEVLRSAAQKQLPVMDALRMGASTLSLIVDDGDDAQEAAKAVVGAFPTIIATYSRLLNGTEPIAPRSDLSHAANYLYMLTGKSPDSERVRALETYLNTVSDHGLNNSTFVARTIVSTQSDMISAIVGAIGALKGPIHGGAPGPALDMVFAIGTPENAEDYIRAKLERGERLMGFGHRVYKVRDPRAEVLNTAAERFFADDDKAELYALVRYVEDTAIRLLEEYKPGRNLQTNVEFYTALVLHGVGLATDLFSPTFAIARVAGWTAHAFEHMAEGRLIRPKSLYTGDFNQAWLPREVR